MKVNRNLSSKKLTVNVLSCVLVSVFTVVSPAPGKVISPARRQNDEAAEQVLKQARHATRKDLKDVEIKGLIITLRTEVSEPYPEETIRARPQYRNQRNQGTMDRELGISFPDKVRDRMEDSYATNQQRLERTLNGDRFEQKSEVLVDGKPINFVVNNANPKSEKQRIAGLKRSAFLTVFPVILDYSWYSPSQFRYIGVAEAKGTRADVIEVTLSDAEKYRFFFDQETHLLLMMIETLLLKETNREIERKYFFSDYGKEDGLLVAHRTVVETNKEVVAERTLKRLQTNPTFKPDYFVVKGK